MARCGAFSCARISTSTPATLRPSISTSFGSLIVVLRENSFRIASETASAAQAVSCGELFRSILGRKRMENQSPFPAVDSHRLPRWPRPAVWCSAKSARPSSEFGLVICKIASLVEPVCPSTIISRPITAPPRSARSSLAIKRSNTSTRDMGHFQADVDCACRMCKTADRNIIHSGGCKAIHILESDPAARFEFDTVFFQRDGLPNLSRRHVVEHDYVNPVNFDEGTNLFEIVGLHFDSDIWSFLPKLFNPVCKTGESLKSSQMIVFHEYHVV